MRCKHLCLSINKTNGGNDEKVFCNFCWLEIILGLAMLWMTFDVGLRATGPFFGALIVLIGIVLLYGLLIYALVGGLLIGNIGRGMW